MQYIDDDHDNMIGNNNNNEWTKKLVHTAVREMHEELQYDIDSLGSTTGISHHARGSMVNNMILLLPPAASLPY